MEDGELGTKNNIQSSHRSTLTLNSQFPISHSPFPIPHFPFPVPHSPFYILRCTAAGLLVGELGKVPPVL